MENSKIYPLAASTPVMVLPSNVARSGYRIENLTTVPLLVRTNRPPVFDDVNEVQKFSLNNVPDGGSVKFKLGNQETAAVAHDDITAADVQTALRTLDGYGAVTVGLSEGVFTVTFVGAPAPAPLLQVVENSLLKAGTPAEFTYDFADIDNGDSGSFVFEKTVIHGKIAKRLSTPQIAYDASAASIQTTLRQFTGDSGLTAAFEGDDLEVTFSRKAVEPLIRVVSQVRHKVTEVQEITFDGDTDSGNFKLTFGELGETDAITYSATPATLAGNIQTAIRALDDATDDVTVAHDDGVYVVTFVGFEGPQPLLVVSDNALVDDGSDPVDAPSVSVAIQGNAAAIAEAPLTVDEAGSADESTMFSITRDTVAERVDFAETVGDGATLDRSTSRNQGKIYIAAAATASVKVVEL